MKKLSDYVIESLAEFGVKNVFMLTGGGCMHLTDSIGRHPAMDYVCCLHEQACAFAAEHYAEYTNHLGVALVTTGPGGTNAITGLTAAWLESAPVLFLSGQAKRADLMGTRGVRTMGPQEVNIVSIVQHITKYAKTILEPESIRYELEKALYLATHGRRGPVWLDLPLDLQASQIDEVNLAGFDPPAPALPMEKLETQVARAIELLNRAERPVLLIGNGCRKSPELLRQLIETLHIPVLVTWKAIDMVANACEFYAGRPGLIGQRGANFTQQNSDCILIAGARLDLLQTAFNHRNFARAASKIMVEIDPAEIAKLDMDIDVPVCADTADFMRELLRQGGSLEPKKRTCWVKRAKELQERYPLVTPQHWQSDGFVSTYALVDVLSDELGPDDLIVPGSSGACSEVLLQAFRVKAGQRIVNAPTLGAMGTGLPGTIGACIASGRRTTCINGDGGFQLNIQELETVHRLNLPIKYFVLCNGSYASIMATQRNYFQGRFTGADPSSRLTFPDMTRVAAAYGIQTAHIHDHSDLRQKVREVLAMEGPVICAVNVSSSEPTAPRVSSQVRPDGTILSAPMEDMWPLLDRDEFAANMIIPPLQGG